MDERGDVSTSNAPGRFALTLVAVGLLGLVLVLCLLRERRLRSQHAPVAREQFTGDDAPALQHSERDSGNAGRESASANEEDNSPVHAARPVSLVRGQVLDLGGQPRAQVGIVNEARPSAVLTATSDDGSFVLPKLEGGACLLATGPHLTTVLKSCCTASVNEAEAVLVVSPAVDVRGRVVSPTGDAVAGCAIWLDYEESIFRRLGRAMDSTTFQARWTKTDESGAFFLSEIPTGEGLRLRFTHAGFLEDYAPIPPNDQSAWLFTLQFDDTHGPTLRGLVLLPNGHPAGGATVHLGDAPEVRADEHGAFAIQAPAPEAGMVLQAWKAGYLPASIDFSGLLDSEGAAATHPISLVLGESALSIAGTLSDSAGAPQTGWEVTLAMGTEINRHRLPPEYLESRIGLEPRPITTGVGGTFVIDGLLSRSYVLRFTEALRKINFETDPIDAGVQDARVRIPDDLVRERLDGRVLSRSGSALAGAEVIAMAATRCSNGISTVRLGSTHTDSEGRFALTHLPRRSLMLSVSDESVVPAYEAIPSDWDSEEYVVRVGLKCHIRVNCSQVGADSFSVLDEDGKPQLIWVTSQINGPRAPIANGSSDPLTIGDNACTLVVYQGERELGRRSFTPLPNSEVVVEF